MKSKDHLATVVERLLTDDLFFAETVCRVVDMSSPSNMGRLVPFRVSAMPMQADFVERVIKANKTRAVELKARRVGGTTLFMLLGLVKACRTANFHVGLVAQNEPEALRFGRLWKQLVNDMEPRIRLPDGTILATRPEIGMFSDSTIEFPKLASSLMVGTAGSTKLWLGQSLNMLIGTEVAKWDVGRPPGTAEEMWVGVEGALVPGGFAVLESTAYGSGGFFHGVYTDAKLGKNGWMPVFYSWMHHPLYRLEANDPDVLDGDRGSIVLTDVELALGLTPEQARWRRFKIASRPASSDVDKLSLFLQEYPEDDVTCFSVSGSPFFDIQRIDEAYRAARPILTSEENGCLLVWTAPRIGESYIVGVDPGGQAPLRARGGTPLDFACAVVVDGRGNHVATLHGQWDIHTFSELVARLGERYNRALVIVEAGPYGSGVLLALNTYLRYPNLYVEKDVVTHKPIRVGKLTDMSTKPIMADNVKELFETGVFRTDDKTLLEEMRNYHRIITETGRISLGATAGHDDVVMAATMACWAWREGGWRHGHRTKVYLPDGRIL